jgi:hypothetical protein
VVRSDIRGARRSIAVLPNREWQRELGTGVRLRVLVASAAMKLAKIRLSSLRLSSLARADGFSARAPLPDRHSEKLAKNRQFASTCKRQRDSTGTFLPEYQASPDPLSRCAYSAWPRQIHNVGARVAIHR